MPVHLVNLPPSDEEDTAMNQPSRMLWPRNSYGFVSVKHLVLIAVVFGAYTGCKFLPVSFIKGQVEHAVEMVLDDTNHLVTDEAIKAKIVNAATAGSLSLEASQIQVQRETMPGSRIIHVDVHYPVAVNYLGSERTVNTNVSVTKVIQVNEAAEARRIERERQQREAAEQAAERTRRFSAEVKEAWAECEAKHGRGACELTYGFGPEGGPGELHRAY